MANTTKMLTVAASRSLMPPLVTLALWRLRQTWGMLLVTGAGILIAITLVCAVPLYARVVMSAGLRQALASDPQNTAIAVTSSSKKIAPAIISSVTQQLDREFAANLGPYIGQPQFTIQTPYFPLSAITSPGGGITHPGSSAMVLDGAPIEQVPAHLKLIEGRLPQATNTPDSVEVALIPEGANHLHIQPGAVLTVWARFIDGYLNVRLRPITLHVVGIFAPVENDTFWHGADFQSFTPDRGGPTIYYALAPDTTILSTLSHLASDPALKNSVLQQPASITWYYDLAPSHIAVDEVPAIVNGVAHVKIDNANNQDLEQSPYLEQSQTYLPSDTFERYRDRLAVAQLAVICLSLLIAGMVLLFVSIMADVLIDQQTSAIAILRSRGASRRQIFGSLVTQSIGLVILALIIGPFLAIALTHYMVHASLPSGDQGALNLIGGNPLPVILGVSTYALVTAAAAIIAMIIATARTLQFDVLTVRREFARSTHRPLWQRLNLDVVIAIIALTGYGVSLYVTSANVLDPHAALLLLSPLTVLGTVCLLLAAILLFLRFFPRLLQASVTFSGRGRSAGPLLAIAQMARVPRQGIRMILQLSLATAFAFFTLTCIASQTQRISDVTSYQSGADFSGTIPVGLITPANLQAATARYAHIPGVLSASLGFVKATTAGTAANQYAIDFRTVDAATFARTAIWPQQYLPQPLDTLMKQLVAQRKEAIAHQQVPAIVDAATWNNLHLSQGANFRLNFSLSDYNNLIDFKVVGEVAHIPTPDSSLGSGVLADYPTFASVYQARYQTTLAVAANTVWLRTKSDPASLASVRRALTRGNLQLTPLYDRRAMLAALYQDPLYLTLIGVLVLGAIVTLLFALVGNLIASWLSVRSRLTSFTVLRALGAEPRQVVSTLTWEQCIIYLTSIVLGAILGAIFSALVVPALIFTSVAPPEGTTSGISSGAFYLAQTIPPIQIVAPPALGIALVVLVALCIIALIMMTAIVLRSSMSQTLRVNED
ncbi:MAG TPA: FtsX-like permease family protein [Ktedonobacteraceae bacterium]|jgi:putative ABC transport system permease protein|nr:FtsX-like permease family protein [Ktedonobacteraceae bacterium]